MADRSDRFVWEPQVTPACWTCRHKHRGRATCNAFPGGIPEFILDGSNQHREPVEGDNGILYEPAGSEG